MPSCNQGPSGTPKTALCRAPSCEKAGRNRCSRCEDAWYCSRECQKADWKEHKKNCARPGLRHRPPVQMDLHIDMEPSTLADIKRGAQQGKASSQYLLSYLYFQGATGVPKDEKKGLDLLQEASDQGHMNSQFSLAEHYRLGHVVTKDMRRALELYHTAAGQGCSEANFTLGNYYKNGMHGISADASKAVVFYQKAVDAGPRGQNLNGVVDSEGKGATDSKDLQIFQRTTESTHARALFNLATCYAQGEGVARDLQKAAPLYLAAARKGHAGAQNSVGTFYLGGLGGLQRDTAEGLRWLEKAVGQGDSGAQYHLGQILLNGTAAGEVARGAAIMEKAAKQGDHVAQLLVAQCYYEGKGKPQDKRKAVAYLQRSADKDCSAAVYMLGKLTFEGEGGLAQDMGKALGLLERAAVLGHPDAKRMVAELPSRK